MLDESVSVIAGITVAWQTSGWSCRFDLEQRVFHLDEEFAFMRGLCKIFSSLIGSRPVGRPFPLNLQQIKKSTEETVDPAWSPEGHGIQELAKFC
jgi:hypothetical protein